MESDEEPTSMAAAISRKSFMEFMFKGHYRSQLISLMRRVIEYSSESDDDDDDDDDVDVDAKRVRNLKKQMSLIRGTPDSWGELTNICVCGIEPPCVLVKDALIMMDECSAGFANRDVLCMCRYVADVCKLMIPKLKFNDEDDTGRIIEMFVNYMLNRNMMACRNFLYWLDYR